MLLLDINGRPTAEDLHIHIGIRHLTLHHSLNPPHDEATPLAVPLSRTTHIVAAPILSLLSLT